MNDEYKQKNCGELKNNIKAWTVLSLVIVVIGTYLGIGVCVGYDKVVKQLSNVNAQENQIVLADIRKIDTIQVNKNSIRVISGNTTEEFGVALKRIGVHANYNDYMDCLDIVKAPQDELSETSIAYDVHKLSELNDNIKGQMSNSNDYIVYTDTPVGTRADLYLCNRSYVLIRFKLLELQSDDVTVIE